MRVYLQIKCTVEGTAQHLVVAGHTIAIGRAGAEVRLNDHFCSRQHAQFFAVSEGEVRLVDHSRNGTQVNGEWIMETQVHTGDVIRIGQSTLEILEIMVLPSIPELNRAEYWLGMDEDSLAETAPERNTVTQVEAIPPNAVSEPRQERAFLLEIAELSAI